MASIRDVAKAAGVSSATVSNVLNGRTEKVSAETSEKVLATIRTLKYRPTPLERNQKAILSQNLGVMVPHLTEGPLSRHGYFRNVLDGILEAAALRGWSITIFVQHMWYDVGQAVRRSYDGRCDGLIMIAPQPGNEVVQMMRDRGTQLVLVGTTPWISNVSSVDIDNSTVGLEAARHLVKLKHRTLAFCSDADEQVSSIERREAFFREAERLGVPNNKLLWFVYPGDSCLQSEGEYLANQIVAAKTLPTGVFCWHDGMAAEVVSELSRLGFEIPKDISVIGVDDAPEAQRCTPPLTTFKNPLNELGRRATKMIIDRLTEGGDAAETVRFAPDFVQRASTGEAPSMTHLTISG